MQRSTASRQQARWAISRYLYFADQNDIKPIANVAFVEKRCLRAMDTRTSPEDVTCFDRAHARAQHKHAVAVTCTRSRSKLKSEVSGRMCSSFKSEKNDRPCAFALC